MQITVKYTINILQELWNFSLRGILRHLATTFEPSSNKHISDYRNRIILKFIERTFSAEVQQKLKL